MHFNFFDFICVSLKRGENAPIYKIILWFHSNKYSSVLTLIDLIHCITAKVSLANPPGVEVQSRFLAKLVTAICLYLTRIIVWTYKNKIKTCDCCLLSLAVHQNPPCNDQTLSCECIGENWMENLQIRKLFHDYLPPDPLVRFLTLCVWNYWNLYTQELISRCHSLLC